MAKATGKASRRAKEEAPDPGLNSAYSTCSRPLNRGDQKRRRAPWRVIDCAAEYLGESEVYGPKSNPVLLAMLQHDNGWPQDDKVPHCSAGVAWWAFNSGHERSKSLRARSWIGVGREIWTKGAGETTAAQLIADDVIQAGDVFIFSRGRGKQPGPEVIKAPGHVALFTGVASTRRNGAGWYEVVYMLGANQGDTVSIKPYSLAHLLAVRRLRRDPALGFRSEMVKIAA